jgi:hypothetical protein
MNQLLNQFNQPSVLNLEGRDFREALHASKNGQEYMNHGTKERRGQQWSPYEVNEGTVAAIVAEDSIIMACDSR